MVRTKHPTRWWVVRGAWLGTGVLLVWIAFFAERPRREVAVMSIGGPDGSVRRLSLREAPPLLNLTFFAIPSAYVEFAGREVKLHGTGFGENVGDVLVSPTHDKAIALRRYKNSVVGAIVIDLQTGEMNYTDDELTWAEASGWERRSWW
jgi:hypothetical protein